MKSLRLFGMASLGSIAASLVLTSAPALAGGPDLITFDDVSEGYPLSSPYHGFNWTNFGILSGTTLPGSGYANGVVSGPNVGYNGFGSPAWFMTSVAGNFTLTSGYFTGAWNNGLSIQVDGKNSGTTVFTKTFVVNTTGPTKIDFNWSGLDEVDFTSFGGVNVGLGGSGTHFAVDNIQINGTSAVPEPGEYATLGLFCSGLAIGMIRARRRKA